MRILHVISGISPGSGGPTRSVKGICRALDKAGISVSLLVLHGDHQFEDKGRVEVVYGRIPDDLRRFDIVHLQGLWDPGLHRVAVACRKAGVPYVISPRGMLDPWALSVKTWKKKVALWLYQLRDLKRAAAFHVTAEVEAQHVRELGLGQKCIVAPNGVGLPGNMPPRTAGNDALGRRALFLSRLHPGKGLLTLAEAWARVKPAGWTMMVVGPDSYGHKADVVSRLKELGILELWRFVGMVDDEEKWRYYCSSDLLIHPSVSENFGITIAEGLAAGLPVIATNGTPWNDLTTYNAGWWIDQGVDALSEAILAATSITDNDRSAMGHRGRRLVETKYTWDAVCGEMIKGYNGVLNK